MFFSRKFWLSSTYIAVLQLSVNGELLTGFEPVTWLRIWMAKAVRRIIIVSPEPAHHEKWDPDQKNQKIRRASWIRIQKAKGKKWSPSPTPKALRFALGYWRTKLTGYWPGGDGGGEGVRSGSWALPLPASLQVYRATNTKILTRSQKEYCNVGKANAYPNKT